jgi:hypothetical protein
MDFELGLVEIWIMINDGLIVSSLDFEGARDFSIYLFGFWGQGLLVSINIKNG